MIIVPFNSMKISINYINQLLYSTKKNAKEIMELTRLSKFEMNSEQFYNLIVTALSNINNTIVLGNSTYYEDKIVLEINWNIYACFEIVNIINYYFNFTNLFFFVGRTFT